MDVGTILLSDVSDKDGLHSAVSAEAHVAGTVANHHRVGKVNVREVGLGLHGQSWFGFAALAAASGKVGAYIDAVDVQPVTFQDAQQMAVDHVHLLLCADAFSDSLLVGDNDDFSEIAGNERYGLQKILPEFQFGNVFHVVVDPQNVNDTVTIQK